MLHGLLLLLLISSFYVTDIYVENNNLYSDDFIIGSSGLKVKIPLTKEDLARAIQKLFSTEYFDQIEIQVLPNTGDTTFSLKVWVKENPKVRKIEIQGTKKIKSKELLDSLKIQVNTPFSSRNLFRWRNIVENFLKKRGFYSPSVEFEVIETEKKDTRDLKIKITEGPLAYIKRIEIHGNQTFPDNLLENHMKNREKKWYRKARFLEDYFSEDLEKIVLFYQNNGFPNARVDSSKITLEDNKLYIDIFLTENERIWFGDVYFDGNNIFSEEFLRGIANLRGLEFGIFERLKHITGIERIYSPLGVYRKTKVEEVTTKLYELYMDSGYIYVQIQPQEIYENDTTIGIKFRIREGHKVRVRKVVIKGNTKTQDKVIRREIDILPGNYFSRQLLIKSQRDLYFLNYFENVEVSFSPVLEDTNYIDVIFTVKEKPTGQLGLGASYSGSYGASIYLQLQNPNFLGRGQTVNFLFEYGQKIRNFQIGLTEPYLFGRRHSLGISLYNLTNYFYEYNSNRLGGSIYYARKIFNDYHTISLNYKAENIRVFNIIARLRSLPEFKFWEENSPLFTSSLKFSYTFDTRNRIFNATEGYKIGPTLELTGGPLLGEVHYLRPELEVGQYYSYEKWVGVYHLRGGWIGGIFEREKVPFYEKYYLGDIGYYGIRGYPYRSIGPKVGGQNVGGRVFSILTLELRYRISENMYVFGFVDVGDAWEHIGTFLKFQSLINTKKGIGMGFRMEMPMLGIIGFDLGYGLATKEITPHFQFGITGF